MKLNSPPHQDSRNPVVRTRKCRIMTWGFLGVGVLESEEAWSLLRTDPCGYFSWLLTGWCCLGMNGPMVAETIFPAPAKATQPLRILSRQDLSSSESTSKVYVDRGARSHNTQTPFAARFAAGGTRWQFVQTKVKRNDIPNNRVNVNNNSSI